MVEETGNSTGIRQTKEPGGEARAGVKRGELGLMPSANVGEVRRVVDLAERSQPRDVSSYGRHLQVTK